MHTIMYDMLLPYSVAVLLVLGVLCPPYTQWGADGYSAGAPDSACVSMTPSHGVSPQTSHSPYTLTPGGISVNGGGNITVTLSSTSAVFEGFLLQARDTGTQQPIGTFITTQYKYLTCGSGYNVSTCYTV